VQALRIFAGRYGRREIRRCEIKERAISRKTSTSNVNAAVAQTNAARQAADQKIKREPEARLGRDYGAIFVPRGRRGEKNPPPSPITPKGESLADIALKIQRYARHGTAML